VRYWVMDRSAQWALTGANWLPSENYRQFYGALYAERC
jgi:hypothetical protein